MIFYSPEGIGDFVLKILLEFRPSKSLPETLSHKIERLALRYGLLILSLYELGTYLHARFFH